MFAGLDTRASFAGRLTPKLLSDVGGTIFWNPFDRWAKVVLSGTGRTLVMPYIPKVGWTGLLYVRQDGTGSRTITTYPSYWSWMGGTAITLTLTANRMDIFSAVSDGFNVFVSASLNGVSTA